ncbi:hypothetical protein, partial [Phocaeicola vulgatus]|uniref:hypothetical protein n=1 Tax=Phocaeicola vulgatus TaxID=821 RepID=UPI001C708A4F
LETKITIYKFTPQLFTLTPNCGKNPAKIARDKAVGDLNSLLIQKIMEKPTIVLVKIDMSWPIPITAKVDFQ